jgi:hypothetical protein
MPSQRSDLIHMGILFSRHRLVFLISGQILFSDTFLDSRICRVTYHSTVYIHLGI